MSSDFVSIDPRSYNFRNALELNPAQKHLLLQGEPDPIKVPAADDPISRKKSFKFLYEQKREELKEASDGMEAIMLRQLLKVMRDTVPKPEGGDDYFGESSHATKTFKAMLDDELATKIAGSSDFGIGNRMFEDKINKITQQYFMNNQFQPDEYYGKTPPKRPKMEG